MDIICLNEYVSLNEDISLNEYNFIEWTEKFLEMNIVSSNDYTFCE